MQLTFQEWLRTRYQLIAGGETPPVVDDPEAGPAGGDPNDDPPADPPADPADPDPADPADPNPDPPADDADVEEMDRIKRERDEARDKLAKAEAAAQKAKTEARKAREEAAKKGGNWEAVAREREAELADSNDRAQNAERRAVEAEEALDSFKREVRITRIAAKLGFHDSQDAINALANQPEDTADDKSCFRALRKLAETKKYLVDPRKATGRTMNGDGGATGLTWEQVQKMSEAEVNANWDAVQKVLARGPGG